MKPPLFQLCLLLTRDLCSSDPLQVLRAAITGGVDCVQIREKSLEPREWLDWCRTVGAVCNELGVPWVVNDSAEIAAAAGATGVHLGQDDLHPEDARKIVGPAAWVGWSTHDLEQIDEAAELGVTYAGFGPVFASTTKGYDEGLGAEALAAALAIARVPVTAIGGITVENAWMIPEYSGMAVTGALCGATDPAAAAQSLIARTAPA